MEQAHAAAGERRRDCDRAWRIYLLLGSLACLVYVSLPPLRGSRVVLAVVGLSAVVAVIVGIRRHRPSARVAWACFAAGLVVFWLGELYTHIYPDLADAALPYPSPGDGAYLAVYPILIAGLLALVRLRDRRSPKQGLIDSLIASLGLGLVSWTFLIVPVIHDRALAPLPKLVSIGYPVADLILLAAAIRLAVEAGKRRPAFYLLIASIVTLLVTDFVYGLLRLHGSYHHQLVLDAGWMLFALLWGAAALHPSMRELEQPVGDRQPHLTPIRLGLLTAASLIAPTILLIRGFRHTDLDLEVIITASALLFALVVARMGGLVRQRERSIAREQALGAAGRLLVAATSRAEIAAAALMAVRSLVDEECEPRLCRIATECRVFAVVGDGSDGIVDWSLSGDVAAALTELASAPAGNATRLPAHAQDVLRLAQGSRIASILELSVHGHLEGLLVLAGRAPIENGAQRAVRTLAHQVSLALESAALTEEVHRQASEARFASLIQNSSDLITLLDGEATILYQSPAIERVLGYLPEDLVGRPFGTLLRESDRSRLERRLTDALSAERGSDTIECSLQHRDGSERYFEILYTNLLEDPVVSGIVLNGRDVSERHAFEEQLAHQAFHDPVTHLANRALFNERVRHAVARARRERISLAVIFVDLDDFKTVNDSLGHAAGDSVLLEVAQRLASSIRASDTAARFGGDEFAVLLDDIKDPGAAAEIAERILASFSRPLRLEQKELMIRASLGISFAEPETATDADELIRNADAAMYIAKSDGKGSYRLFEPVMHESVVARLELRADLERALAHEEFELYYQPVVRLSDRSVMGVEALLRWQHPERGLVPPSDFIPFAEETGLIVPLGKWVLREGCRQAKVMRERFASTPPLNVSINLSVKQLFHNDIVADVSEALEESGLEPSALTLEITESVMMTDTEHAVQRLAELKRLGVLLAMDDFGTGYSSLSSLSRFPLDVLKMDRSLLREGASPVTSGLATAVLGLGATFDLQVVAEGIEYPEQWDTLRELGCALGQGFFFARPMAQESVIDYLEQRSGASGAAPSGGA